MNSTEPYNPLEKKHLGESVAEALLRCDPIALGGISSFEGAGIYVLYYTGDFAAYEPISARNRGRRFELPIYVGKAVPPGARKGKVNPSVGPGPALTKRLRQHHSSIKLVENLDVEDFYCRFLVVDDVWIPLGESLLIAKFAPLWNRLIDGFGIHTPGVGRFKQERSRWDVLHPGRPWALKCKQRKETAEQITGELEAYLRDHLD